jgi:hypothetical protein
MTLYLRKVYLLLAAFCLLASTSCAAEHPSLACNASPEIFCNAFAVVEKEVPTNELNELKHSSEADLVKFDTSLGLFIRNRLELWSDNDLTRLFQKNGVSHPDMMSHVLLIGLSDYLNGKAVDMMAITRAAVGKLIPPLPPKQQSS